MCPWGPGQAVNTTSFVLKGGGRHMPVTDPALISPILDGIPSFCQFAQGNILNN
jgi:hypothetical protein